MLARSASEAPNQTQTKIIITKLIRINLTLLVFSTGRMFTRKMRMMKTMTQKSITMSSKMKASMTRQTISSISTKMATCILFNQQSQLVTASSKTQCHASLMRERSTHLKSASTQTQLRGQ